MFEIFDEMYKKLNEATKLILRHLERWNEWNFRSAIVLISNHTRFNKKKFRVAYLYFKSLCRFFFS